MVCVNLGEPMTAVTTKTIDPELVKAAASFEYYLFHHVFIRDVLPDGSSRTIQFQHWPLHDEILADLRTVLRLVVLKARQLGWSWLLAAWIDWQMLFTEGFKAGMTSAGELEAAEFIDKCRFILTHLPYETPAPIEPDNQLIIGVSGSTLMGFPSTPKAGRGFNFNLFVADEAAYHPWAQEAYASYEAATEYGQIIIVSSAGDTDKQVTNDCFQRLWQGAPENGFRARFYPWSARPGRDAEWYEVRAALLSGRTGSLEREYPNSPEEAFRSMLSPYFDAGGLDAGRQACTLARTQVHLPEGLTPEYLQIWSEPRSNEPYVIYSEAGEGVGKDYTVTTVAESRTLRVVARFRENVLTPEVHGVKARKLAVWYNNAFASWERNKGEGIAAAYAGYERVYQHPVERTTQQIRAGAEATSRPGIPITEATRDFLLQQLYDAIKTGALNDPDAAFWEEADRFIVVERTTATGQKHYRAQAAVGAHDDIVMCGVGIVHLAKQPGAQRLRSTEPYVAVVKEWGGT